MTDEEEGSIIFRGGFDILNENFIALFDVLLLGMHYMKYQCLLVVIKTGFAVFYDLVA